MTNPSHRVGTAQGALRDAVLALGGVIAVRQPGDELVEAIADLLAQIEKPRATTKPITTPVFGEDDWQRLPGLLRRWEVEQVLDEDHDLHVESAGRCEDGTSLFAAYARSREPRRDER